ncbi:MAG TPA: 4Fe-4S binding protein [Spirochaetota bacterium]|nr:4Fe-4S binding protein [Spirochaetota bacterium]HPR47768.1 4Fe-4S binding protein [Spirochaetota bacterium]
MNTDELSKKYHKAASIIATAGIIPFAVSETLIEIIRFYLDEEDVDFIITNFDRSKSLSLEQLKTKSGLSDELIEWHTSKLARKGFIFNQPNTSGAMVYRLLPLILVGTFEYTFMKKLPEKDESRSYEKIAVLYHKLLEELRDNIQRGYDSLLPIFENQPPVDRTVPVFTSEAGKTINIIIDKKIEAVEDVLPSRTVEAIIAKFDDIAVGHCFCRNYNKVLGHDCEINAPSEVCFTFGKSARHTIAQGFARAVTQDEALKIMKEAEEAGLVHKAFHNSSNIAKEENSICNCCKDCCDTFTLWRNGAVPMVNSTNYLSIINEDDCTGCGICVDRCPVDAISLNDSGIAVREESYCIGCGICARFCPSDAISLKEGMRRVYVPPPRLR